MENKKRIKLAAFHGLPSDERYQLSLSHPDTVSHVMSLKNGLFATASIDGFVQFSRLTADKYESLKIFKVHSAPLTDFVCSASLRYAASISLDMSVKIFDLISLDVIKVLKLDFVPECACIVDDPVACSDAVILLSPRDSAGIHYVKFSENSPVRIEYPELITKMAYNKERKSLVVANTRLVYLDFSRLLEGSGVISELAKTGALSSICSLSFSPNFEMIAFHASDRIVRVLDASTLKPIAKFDETISFYKKAVECGRLSPEWFEKVSKLEEEFEETPYFASQSLGFDPDSRVLIYSSPMGIKAVDLESKKIVMTYGRNETFRPVSVCLISCKHEALSVDMAASDNPKAEFGHLSGIVASAFRQPSFHLFTDCIEQRADADRNQSAAHFPQSSASAKPAQSAASYKPGHKAVIHTTLGDITVELYPQATPRTVENFCTLSRRNYYDNLLFHRVIRGFMVQTGCPRGDGTGGESIFGGPFQNELCPELKHDRPFTVSMANSGEACSNTSQFFITTIRAPWLDRKHTVFGRVVGGEDVVRSIEAVDTDRLDRPRQDIRVLSVEILD